VTRRTKHEDDIQLEEHLGCDTYIFDRNRSYNNIEAGTRASAVVITYPHVTDHLRVKYTTVAVRKAAAAWEARWGAIPWSLSQMVVTHVTAQVCVEFRVPPDTDLLGV
jgi:hypothetical protein